MASLSRFAAVSILGFRMIGKNVMPEVLLRFLACLQMMRPMIHSKLILTTVTKNQIGFTLTMKVADDLFKRLSEMGYNEKSSFPEYNDAKLSQVANMDSFHPGYLNDPPSPREHDHINRTLESYHIMPTKEGNY